MEIISATYILPMTHSCPIIKNGAIATELNKIHDIGTLNELTNKYPDAEVKEYTNSILMPGLVNAYSQLELVSFYDSTDPMAEFNNDAPEFTEHLVSAIEFKQDTTSPHMIPGIQKGINRLIETGVTCISELTAFEGTFKLLREMGLRSIIYPEIIAGHGENAQHSFEIALALIDRYYDLSDDRIQIGLGPYAPYLLSRNLLRIIGQHAIESSIPILMHAAESFAEMEFFFDSQGPIATDIFPSLGWKNLPPAHRKTPISYLSELGLFDAPTTLVGCLQLSDNDYAALARNLVKVVLCPSYNHAMKFGTFPYGKLCNNGIPIGLGTGPWHSKLGFNMWEEMRLCMDNACQPKLPAKDVLKLATMGSARAMGLDHRIGSLEPNKAADYIILHEPNLNPDNESEFYKTMIERTDPHHIKVVVVDGNILKSI